MIQTGPIETPEAPAAFNRAANASTLGPSHFQTSTGLIHDQGGAIRKTDANSSAVSQARGARQVEVGSTHIATMARADKFRSILGEYLFKGMERSRMRKGEKERTMPLTDTVRLHCPLYEGQDFKLEVTLGFEDGLYVVQTIYLGLS